MTRSHPPSLLTLARRTVRAHRLFSPGDRVLVAVSGGPDSTALLHVLALLQSQLGHRLLACGVDHRLRSEARGELEQVKDVARSLAVPFRKVSARVEVGGNLQARARAARYAALRKVASTQGARWIATAHHADDRAETVLLRLLRGAGPTGLAVLPPRTADLVRPFHHARRTDIAAHLERHALPYSYDPSNADPRFLRARVRHELLPVLMALSPGIVGHLNALADALLPRDAPDHGRDPFRGLPRATQNALRDVIATRAMRAEVWLPGGLVARLGMAPGDARPAEPTASGRFARRQRPGR